MTSSSAIRQGIERRQQAVGEEGESLRDVEHAERLVRRLGVTQRPDLAKVAFPAVGVMDMLRYHKFTAGAGWAYDYGTADDSKEMLEYLKKYSPVHRALFARAKGTQGCS